MAEMNFLEKSKLKSSVFWDYMRPFRRGAYMYSWTFGYPLMIKALDLTIRGAGTGIDALDWTRHMTIEAGKGAGQMAFALPAMTAYSRAVELPKRMLWDVPIATGAAAIKTPIAIATSPLEAVYGVRDALQFVSKTKEGGLMAGAKALASPITRPLGSIIAPVAHLGSTALGAELQTFPVMKTAITEKIPEGFRRIQGAPAYASSVMAEIIQLRELKKAALEQEKQEKREQLEELVAQDKGVPLAKPANDNAKPMRRAA